MLNYLVKLPRKIKQLTLIFSDLILLLASLITSYSIRQGYWSFPFNESGSLQILVLIAPFIAIPVFIKFGLYRAIIRFIGFKALWAVIQSVTIYSLILSLIFFMSSINGFPRSALIINWLLLIISIAGTRLIAMWLLTEYSDETSRVSKNIVIYGAGSAGRQLFIALTHSSEYRPIAFIDDESSIHGTLIKGFEVYPPSNLEYLIEQNGVNEVLLAIPSISRRQRIKIMNFLSTMPVRVRSLPGVSELAQGKVDIADLRKLDINDLLGRLRVNSNEEISDLDLSNKVVLVTGAGGSIGSELCRQIINLNATILILYEISEFALYEINDELNDLINSGTKLYPVLGSVEDKKRFSHVLSFFKVQTVYHAAAYKHVPMVEFNNSEGVKNNIFATFSCAEVAIQNKVESFVLVSTDKAVRPTNTMGATKRFSEQLLQGLSELQNTTKFTIVRFGNVLGSSGSVIPLFKKQINKGGPVTVTDKKMTRYFMLISEAVELIIQANEIGYGGEVFVLDMGEPVNINDFAKKMINLSGLTLKDKLNPDGDIEIIYTGIRPGEKLYEELLIGKDVSETKHPMIWSAKEDYLSLNKLKLIMIELNKAVKDNNHDEIRRLLIKAVPEFKPKSQIEDILYKNLKSKI
jgi:FlaA1/EpsC-like NDP-sugar epimerase